MIGSIRCALRELEGQTSEYTIQANPSAIRVHKIAKACGCKFYLGSDAHTPSSLANALPRFQAIVDALELTEDDKFAFA